MLRKMTVFALVVVSMIVLAVSDANAGFYINGHYYTKGVQCVGDAIVKNIDKNMLSLACSIAPATCDNGNSYEVILVCQNPGGNISTGRAFVQGLTFAEGLGSAQVSPDKKGKVTFDAVVNGTGINPPQNANCTEGDAYCNCDYDTDCSSLRAYCPNNNWLPIDVTPITMIATVASYYCDNDAYHSCACDPNITDPVNYYACATSLGSGKQPWSFDWSLTGGLLVPAATETSYCTLPNPGTWQIGEVRQYDCTVCAEADCSDQLVCTGN